jgi:hypothetical protein
MANNLDILDATGTTKTVKTTDNASVHTPHHIVDSVTGTVTVAGTGTFVTQSVVTNAGTFAVQATQAGTWNITNVSGTVSLPTGASTAANQSTIIGHVDGIEALLGTIDADTGSIDGKIVACNTGAVVLSSGTVTTVSTVTNLSQLGGVAVAMGTGTRSAGTQRVTIATDDSVPVTGTFWQATQPVSLASLPALAAGTNAIGKLSANSGVDIGDVDVTSAVISSGTLTTCSTVTTLTTLTGSGIAHDGVDSGNPHKIGARATASVLGGTPVAAADRTDLLAGLDGVQFTRPHTSLEDIISEVKTNTDGASTAMTGAFAATASQRIYLTSLIIANSSSTNITVDIRDGSAGSVLATFPVPANGGCIHAFPVPLRFSANTAAAFDGSAAATTLSVSMVGFKSKQ